jgi:two-component system NtrC family sensor kinase
VKRPTTLEVAARFVSGGILPFGPLVIHSLLTLFGEKSSDMRTIRGKIVLFFILCLTVAGVLALLSYQDALSLRQKIYAIERFDDLLNDVLELRRYEKNIIFYKDPTSLEEAMIYLRKVDHDYNGLKPDIAAIIGPFDPSVFDRKLQQYHQTLDAIIALQGGGGSQLQEERLRANGKALVDFAQLLIEKKRSKIDQTLKRVLIIPLASIAFLIVLAIAVFRFLTQGVLKPLLMLEDATEKVAKESFTPIPYGKDSKDEIARLIASFNKMVAELDSRQEQLVQSRKLASIGVFTSGIAHELNNPLNNIAITAEALTLNYADVLAPEVNEMIDDIATQADRASQVVKNLLEFSRTKRAGLKDLAMHELLESTLKLVKNQLSVAQIQIEKDIAPDLPLIHGKQQDLQQAFVNIFLNAVQAMPEGGKITIRAGRDPRGYLQVDLSDTGTGIKPENLENIFDPFYTTKSAGSGTGLGLSIVYSIIRSHGGTIEARSEVGQGTTFSICLPVIAGRKADQDAA